MPSSRGSSRPRDQTHVSYISLLHWQAGSLPLAPPQKLSSPVEFIINLPIQKSTPFFSSYLNPVLNSTLIILEYYTKSLTMIMQLLNEIGENIQFQRNLLQGKQKIKVKISVATVYYSEKDTDEEQQRKMACDRLQEEPCWQVPATPSLKSQCLSFWLVHLWKCYLVW